MQIGRVLIAAVGLIDAMAGAALLLAPEWFFEVLGTFPPFNRHYAGDAGAFLLPIGIGLLLAAREPARYRAVLGLGLVASWLHAINHGYDAIVHPGEGAASVLDAANVVAIAAALTLGAWLTRRGRARDG